MAGTWASLLSILGFRFCICKLDLKFVDHFPLLSPSDHPGSGPRCDRGIMVPVRSWEIPREKEDEKEQKDVEVGAGETSISRSVLEKSRGLECPLAPSLRGLASVGRPQPGKLRLSRFP